MAMNLFEYLRNLGSQKPPFACPHEDCDKIYKSRCGIQYHLTKYVHNLDKQGEPTTSSNGPTMKMRRRKRKRFTILKLKGPRRAVTFPIVNLPVQSMTYSESSKFVDFHINNEYYRVSKDKPLAIISKLDYEAKYGPIVPANINNNIFDSIDKLLPLPTFSRIDDYVELKKITIPNDYIIHLDRSRNFENDVEYDMDEEDFCWLDIINAKRNERGLPDVSIDSFEFLMDKLEKESYFQSKPGPEENENYIDDDAVCSICMLVECQYSNVILFCDLCNLAVHQDCYGVPYIPEEQWLCRRCMHSPSCAVQCILCPNSGGAFKQTDTGQWVHVVCALWIPEVGFANSVFLEPIDYIQTIPKARWKLTCYLCNKKRNGVCIQCSKTNCYISFHVTCAQKAGLYMKTDKSSSGENVGSPDQIRKVYCSNHSPSGEELQSSYFKKADTKETYEKDISVLSIPTIPLERIQNVGAQVDFPAKSEFILRLMSYWTMKRLSHNGAPLIRRLQTASVYKAPASKISPQKVSGEIVELKGKLVYMKRLRQHLEKARILIELVRKREKMKRQLIDVEYLCLDSKLKLCATY